MLRITAYADRLLEDLGRPRLAAAARWPCSATGSAAVEGAERRRSSVDGRTTAARERVHHAPRHAVRRAPTWCSRPSTRWSTCDDDAREQGRGRGVRATQAAARKSDRDRTPRRRRRRPACPPAAYAINPVNGAQVPIWIADYVLGGLRHRRDHGRARRTTSATSRSRRQFEPADRRGRRAPTATCTTSSRPPSSTTGVARPERASSSTGSATPECKRARSSRGSTSGARASKRAVHYKLRDWLFSRQRYWGEPFPIYFVDADDRTAIRGSGAAYTIRYDQPIAGRRAAASRRAARRSPTSSPGDDRRPAGARRRVELRSDRTASWYARETNTMPQWAGSCWYYLRFLDPQNDAAAWVARGRRSAWMPVDLYVGGAEHARAAPALRAVLAQGALRPRPSCSTPEPLQRSSSTRG